jgi:hypothetical protein
MRGMRLVKGLVIGIVGVLWAGCLEEEVSVMTYNVYVGADVAPILEAQTMEEIAERVEEAWKMLEATDFRERAAAIVDQIELFEPHLIGLQEVALIRVQSPGDRIHGGLEPATEVVYDYEEILLSELAARGLDYRVAARVQNADVELPRLNETFDDVRLTDHDVILARGDVLTTPALARNYQAAVELLLPDGLSSVVVLRGVVAVEARLGRQRGLFVNTHLETRAFPTIQVLQATELLLALGAHHGPVLLVGDFNSDPDGSSTPTYELITSVGFIDTWTRRLGPPEPGSTCCQAPDLTNEESLLHRRIDFVFGRGLGLRPSRVEIDAWVVGDEPADRTPSGLWPSDHAGVVTELRPRLAP